METKWEPYAYHQELELVVETLTQMGDGLARDNQWVIFIPFALPGERVRARIFRNHRHFSEADLLEVLEASPHRVEPKCALFGKCGGCQYQHLDYEQELLWKQRQVVDCFEKIGGLKDFKSERVVPCPSPYNYRSKITPAWHGRLKENSPIGFLNKAARRL